MLEKKIILLHEKGFSYNKIKEKLGCSKGTISYFLGAGQKEKHIKRQRDRRTKIKKYIQEYKQSHVCADCKENYPYWIMEFDHINNNKEFGLNKAISLGATLDQVKLEIKKCEVVCSNCHKNRTYCRSLKSGGGGMDTKDYY